VALVITDVSEECIAPTNRVTRIDELITTLAVTSNRIASQKKALFTVAILGDPWNFGKFVRILWTCGFSRRIRLQGVR
jgi:hypothetical protein